MKKFYILFSLLFLFINVNAQYSITTKKEAQFIKSATLLVALQEESPKLVEKYSKEPEKLEHYRDQIAGRNEVLKKAVEKYWTFSKNVQYSTVTEAAELMKKEKGKYVRISFGQHLDYEQINTGFGKDGKPSGWNSVKDRTGKQISYEYNKSTKYSLLANVITTLEITDPGNLVKAYLPNVYPSESDVVYGIQQIQYILKYLTSSEDNTMFKFPGHVKKNGRGLKSKTLLLDKDDLAEGLTEKEIKEVYPFNFKIVDQAEIDRAILEKDESVVYVQITENPGSKGNVSSHYISCPADGKIYCREAPTVAFAVKGTNLITYGKRIKLKHLESYAESAE